MGLQLWTVQVKRVSPITGKIGWHVVRHGAGKRRLLWTDKLDAYHYAIAYLGFHDNRSRVVADRGIT